jgi:hypothetical protein
MKRMPVVLLVNLFVLSGSLAALAGCASGPDTAKTASAMESFSLETAKVNDAIDGATQALKALMASPGDNLKSSYSAFSNSVKVVEGRASNVRKMAEEMKARGNEYFKSWEAGSDSGMSKERHAELASAYGGIKDQMQSAKDAFAPYLASLKDIQKLLGLDLTAQGLAGAQPLAAKAEADAAEVKSRIKAVTEQVNSVSGLLSKKPK